MNLLKSILMTGLLMSSMVVHAYSNTLPKALCLLENTNDRQGTLVLASIQLYNSGSIDTDAFMEMMSMGMGNALKSCKDVGSPNEAESLKQFVSLLSTRMSAFES